MLCSIIIPTHRRAEQLAHALDSLSALSHRDFEAIVVVDGEDASTRSMAESYLSTFPLRWIFNSRNQGPAVARNSGVSVATGEILLFLDDDMVVAPDWLAHHLKHHQGNGDIAVLGRIVQQSITPPCNRTERYLQREAVLEFARMHARLVSGRLDLEKAIWFGVNCSMRRTPFLRIGGFDPLLGSTDEDMELGYRLHRSGTSLIGEPEAVVFHHDNKNLTAYYADCWRQGARNDIYRVCVRQQRNGQTARLVRMYEGKLLSRWKERGAWNYPGATAAVAATFRWLGDLTGRSLFYRRWFSLANSCEYWRAIKAEGWTAASLQDIAGSPLRVLTFHSVSMPTGEHERLYYTSPQRFRWLLDWTRMHGYSFVRVTDWPWKPMPENSISLTFDDGYEDFYSEVFPIASELQLHPTVFVVVNQIGRTNEWDELAGFRSRRLLSAQQIREMHSHGVTFGSHTLTHPQLSTLNDAELRMELRDSKAKLEDLLGSQVTSFCYPFGGVDERVRRAVLEAGYKIAVTTRSGLNRWRNDPLMMNRIEIRESSTGPELLLKIRTGWDFRQVVSERCRYLLALLWGRGCKLRTNLKPPRTNDTP